MSIRPSAQRVDAALPQIQSLNPLVEVTPIASTHPFILTSLSASKMSPEDEMEAFLKREKVDLVCVTDASRADLVSLLCPFMRVEAAAECLVSQRSV